jgi:hypothetical protein
MEKGPSLLSLARQERPPGLPRTGVAGFSTHSFTRHDTPGFMGTVQL